MKKIIVLLLILIIGFINNPIIFGGPVTDNKGWTNTEVVSTESTKSAYRAVLDVDQNGTVHIAWKDNTNYGGSGSDWDIFYKMKPRDGNWTTTEVVSTESTEDSDCLFLDVDQSGTVHIVWKDKTNFSNSGPDNDIFYKKKPKDGSWTLTEVVSSESFRDCGCPSLAVDKDYSVHFIWPDLTDFTGFDDEYDIFYKKETKDGSWTKAELVSSETIKSALKTSVAIDPFNTVHVVWEEETYFGNFGYYYHIFYKNKPLGGNWTETELVTTESTSDSLSPFFIVDSLGTLHLAWADKTNYLNSGGNYNIFYKKKPLNENWTTTEVVSTESINNCNWPSLAVDKNQTVHIVWSELSDSTRNDEIFYKKKTKDGSWTKAELVSSESKSNSYFPSIAVDIYGIVHVSWWDEPFDNAVVYYKEKYPEFDQSSVGDGDADDNSGSIDDESTKTPGFEFVLFICTLAIVYLYKRRSYS